jgi:pyruvate/2-oxoglutarate dehydrogenase complex dihydrolipoamide acyltransferase (E2) component
MSDAQKEVAPFLLPHKPTASYSKLFRHRDITEAKRQQNACTMSVLTKAVANAARAYPLVAAKGVPNTCVPSELEVPGEGEVGVDVCYDHGREDTFSVITHSHADVRGLSDIDCEYRKKAGILSRGSELSGKKYGGEGRIALSNLGAYGIKSFSTICIEAHTAVMAFGEATLWPVESASGELSAERFVECTLTADHRAVNGKEAAHFLQAAVSELASLAEEGGE